MKSSSLNNISLFALVIWSSLANADTLDTHIAKLEAVVEKNGRCEFAVAQVPTGERKEQSMLWPKSVVCIGDITVDGGTMRERSGCSAFWLDTYTLRTTGVGTEGRMKIANGKKCNDGGFEEVMGMNLMGYVDEPAGSTNGIPNMSVGWLFYDGSRTNFMTPSIVYLKAKHSKYEAWWSKKNSESKAMAKAQAEKQKIGEENEQRERLAEEYKRKAETSKKRTQKKAVENLWKE